MSGTAALSPEQRREARIALALLPVGAAVTVVSACAFVAVALLAIAGPFRGAPWPWTEGWALAAAAVAAWNTRAGIAIMSAFDWRPLPLTLLLSAAVIAAWLALP